MERGYVIEVSAGFIVEYPAPEDVADLCPQFDELLCAQQAEQRRDAGRHIQPGRRRDTAA